MLRIAALAFTLSFAAGAFAQAPPPAVILPPPEPPAAPPQAASPPPPAPAPATPRAANGDPFGDEVTLTEKTIVSMQGHANWDSAFETLVKTFRQLNDYLDKQGLAPNGPAMTIYTQTDDTGFGFQAALPIAEPPKAPPTGEITLGKSPSGKALKFIHRGSYDSMDSTYEAITNHLDDRKLEAKDLFIEEYVVDPLKTAEDKLVVNVYVPIN